MKSFNLNIFQQIKSMETWEERSKYLGIYTSLTAGIFHFLFIFLFLILGIRELMFINIFFSLPIYIIAYLLIRKSFVTLSFILSFIEMALHALAAVYYIGLETGFHFYLIQVAVTINLFYGWKRTLRTGIFIGFFLIFILVRILFREGGVYTIDSHAIVYSLYVFNFLIFALAVSIFLKYFVEMSFTFEKDLKRKNWQISEQKEEIETQRDAILQQKNELELVHREVTSSINYATRIQQSVLPAASSFTDRISDHFVLYLPKSKVSGDFFWWATVDDYTIIAAADCTGHGVPGAFMSMLGITYLREIVLKEKITRPSVILEELRKEVVKGLKQKGETGEQKDGMDMALVSIDHKKKTVQFSGANNPLYIVTTNGVNTMGEEIKGIPGKGTDSTLYEIKADRMPIGIFENMNPFQLHQFKFSEGDTLYLFSDGFADQFGGKEGKKFMYSPFKQLLLENSDESLPEQKEILETSFRNWSREYEQVDDVLVMGIKL